MDDVNDTFPLDPNESADSDGDGVGDSADTDDDNDGVSDVDEAAMESLIAQLEGRAELPVIFVGKGHGGGRATGRLTGGSLTMVAAIVSDALGTLVNRLRR